MILHSSQSKQFNGNSFAALRESQEKLKQMKQIKFTVSSAKYSPKRSTATHQKSNSVAGKPKKIKKITLNQALAHDTYMFSSNSKSPRESKALIFGQASIEKFSSAGSDF